MAKRGAYTKGFRSHARLTEYQQGLFAKGTNFFGNKNGKGNNLKIASPYRELTIGNQTKANRKGTRFTFSTDRRLMELSAEYGGSKKKGMTGRYSRKSWETFGSGEIVKLQDLKQLCKQLNIAAYQLPIALEHWRQVLAQRALAIFQQSFELKRFNSQGSSAWQRNTDWTIKKRKRKRTWPGAGKLMMEYGKLKDSLTYYATLAPFTSAVRATASYAGYHNAPRPGDTYGNGFGGRFSGRKPIVQRQFMGHSTLIDDFILLYEKRYLFDTIFRRQAN